MRMGVREICDVVFRPLTAVDIGNQHFDAGQPVLYLDTAKTSSLEGASTTVYAQGGKGNPRLIGWDGEKTLTFTVEDALISPVSFSMLSGAGIVKGRSTTGDVQKIYTHQIYDLVVEETAGHEKYVKLPVDVRQGDKIAVSKEAPIYATVLDSAGGPKTFLSAIKTSEIYTDASLSQQATFDSASEIVGVTTVNEVETQIPLYFKLANANYTDATAVQVGDTVRLDCYTSHMDGAQEIQIDAESFAGYYYIEADTLFRDEVTGQDLPAQFIIPRGKIQSNFTFTMANSGDPSTFTFTIDAFPAYTKFNKSKKVMAALQIVDPTAVGGHPYDLDTVIGHTGRTSGTDIYGNGLPDNATEADKVYTNSIFNTAGTSATFTAASTTAIADVTYYVNVGTETPVYQVAVPQPTVTVDLTAYDYFVISE